MVFFRSKDTKTLELIVVECSEHYCLWDKVKITDRERCRKQRKLKESDYIPVSPKCMSLTRAELNPMKLPLIMKQS